MQPFPSIHHPYGLKPRTHLVLELHAVDFRSQQFFDCLEVVEAGGYDQSRIPSLHDAWCA